MGNQSKILEHYPAKADFQDKEMIRTRGDVLFYRSSLQRDSFSTDESGFRHSTFKGKTMSVADCLKSDRYGIVLGPSTIFASGVAGNENIMASLLAERFGFPFANAALPGGNSRNLNALLTGLVARAERKPAIVVFSNGGDIANFCESGMADPIFGSPNRLQVRIHNEAGVTADADVQFPALLAFTSLWTAATARRCRNYKSPMVMVHQSTFFEKSSPSAVEIDCELGKATRETHAAVFERFRKFYAPFVARRKELAERLGLPLAGLGLADQMEFIDEFHCTRESIAVLSKSVGDEIEPLLASAGAEGTGVSKPKKKSA